MTHDPAIINNIIQNDLFAAKAGFKVYDPAGHQIDEMQTLWLTASRLRDLWNIAVKLDDAGARTIINTEKIASWA